MNRQRFLAILAGSLVTFGYRAFIPLDWAGHHVVAALGAGVTVLFFAWPHIADTMSREARAECARHVAAARKIHDLCVRFSRRTHVEAAFAISDDGLIHMAVHDALEGKVAAEWLREQVLVEAHTMKLLSDETRLRGVLEAMRARDDRNGSLPPWYREQIDEALAAGSGGGS